MNIELHYSPKQLFFRLYLFFPLRRSMQQRTNLMRSLIWFRTMSFTRTNLKLIFMYLLNKDQYLNIYPTQNLFPYNEMWYLVVLFSVYLNNWSIHLSLGFWFFYYIIVFVPYLLILNYNNISSYNKLYTHSFGVFLYLIIIQ